MKQSKSKVINGTILALGAVVAVLPLTIYRFVETAGMHGMAMSCETACIAETVIGAVIVIVAVVSLFFKSARFGVGTSAVLAAGGVAAIAAPRVIGLCDMPDMACHLITLPTVTIAGAAIIILALLKLAAGAAVLRRPADAVE
jgi:uncharacterized membrane protein YhdT